MVRALAMTLIARIQGMPREPDWISDPHEDNDEESALGFNEPTHWEPGGEADEEN